MTVRTLTAKIPSITLVEGMIIRLEAISPTTGAAIAGVNASRWAIYGRGGGDLGVVDIGDSTPSWVWGGEEDQVA